MTFAIAPLDPASIEASLDRFLDRHDARLRSGLWLFVYGALAADPPFVFADRRAVALQGRRRAFCLADPLNRGTPQHPGLVLGLEPGGACPGLAYRIEPPAVRNGLKAVWSQEMRLPCYEPLWLDAEAGSGRLEVLALDTNRAGPQYRPGVSEGDQAAWIAGSAGPAGTNAAYLDETIEAFAKAGVRDPSLDRLAALVHRRPAFAAGG